MKKILTVIFTILLLMGCKKISEPAIESSSNDFLMLKMENYILSSLSDSIKVKENVEYNSKLNSFANYALDSYRMVAEKSQNQTLKSGNLFGDDLHSFLKSQPKPICFEKPMTALEKSMFLSILNFIDNKRFVETMTILNSAEEFISENMCDKYQRERMLYLVATLKVGFLMRNSILSYTEYTTNLKSGKIGNNIYALSGAAWESCLENCMDKKYAAMNFVEWVEFAVNPPVHVLWSIASCSWDCGWK